ncbi:PhoPQ-activated pathogenicity-related family protein [Exilibacterium tricleocarpae]|uniref:PhoPQ-activated pathogenicity-related family protein n=1 Tax=Exilibacterium tricleocarpae TaxID=2591008 RepID=UPI0015D4454F|nr:PhoPQ-activated protein PqaA family protein [Exilibacterium tricleocarpae]
MTRPIFGTLLFFLYSLSTIAAGPNTALKDYVATPDPAYQFTLIGTIEEADATVYLLLLTSQQWRMPAEVDRTLWQHQLSIVVPHVVSSRTGMIFIGGGDNDDIGRPSSLLSTAGALAVGSGSVVGLLGQIPNQPLVFADEPGIAKEEDDLVAFTFDKAMDTGDYTWPAYLPMVKSVVRSMDAVQAFLTASTPAIELDDFVITGFSKRGATAWLTAVVDPRVTAVAPGVFDVLNFTPSFESHRASYGAFSSALAPYVEYDILDRARTREGRELLQVVDPFTYRDRLTLPKYILAASGDEFFPVDSGQFYADALQGEALFRYLPNTNHGGANGGDDAAFAGLLAWYLRVINRQPRPQVQWHVDDGTLRVTTDGVPLQASLWQANNPSARDFRFDEVGAIWHATPLTADGDGSYVARLENPVTGWSGYFVELVFPGLGPLPEVYTTPVFITPETRPFSLDQPLGDPRRVRFWRREFAAALGENPGYRPLYDAAQLHGFLPVRVFDDYFFTLERVRTALTPEYPRDQEASALSQCLAARLNVQSQQIDWYSPMRLFFIPRQPFWKLWNGADRQFRRGRPSIAENFCRIANLQ